MATGTLRLILRLVHRGLAAAALFAAAEPAATATSFFPMADEALVAQAPVAAVVEVESAGRPAPGGRLATDYEVRIEDVLKGSLPAAVATVRVPGGVSPWGFGLKVWGAPQFEPGRRALLLLAPNRDGTYGIVHLMLGAFHEVAAGAERFAVRDLSEATALSRSAPGGAGEEGLRSFDRFARWVARRGHGEIGIAADYRVAPPAGGLRSVAEDFRFLRFKGTAVRWFDFDTGGSVSWRMHRAGQPGLPEGGRAEIQASLEAWNADPDTPVRYVYAGTTDASGGLREPDGVNAVLFDDPANELPGRFVCGQGGIVALGGVFFDPSLILDYRGGRFLRAIEGDVITNDGLGCLLATSTSAGRETFGHELGHTLGLGHASENPAEADPVLKDALMYFAIRNDGRGARLNADDRAGLSALYGDGTAIEPPLAPATVQGLGISATRIALTWSDAASNETEFRVVGRRGSSLETFRELATAPANAGGTVVGGLDPGATYQFLVRACNAAGCSPDSNQASASTLAGVPDPAPAGAALTAAEVSCDAERLRRLLARLAAVNPGGVKPTGVNLGLTATGDFAGIAYTGNGPTPERQLAFSTNPEETTLLRNPARPQLPSLSMTRNRLSSDLVRPGDPDHLRVLVNTTLAATAAPSLVLDNLVSPEGASDVEPGRGLARLIDPCHRKHSEQDAHVLRLLAKIARARATGAAGTELALFRGEGQGEYRIDVYPVDSAGRHLGRLAVALDVELGVDGALERGTLRVLGRCAAVGDAGCTSIDVQTELLLVRPAAAGALWPPSDARVASPSGPAEAAVDFVELLGGSTWRRQL